MKTSLLTRTVAAAVGGALLLAALTGCGATKTKKADATPKPTVAASVKLQASVDNGTTWADAAKLTLPAGSAAAVQVLLKNTGTAPERLDSVTVTGATTGSAKLDDPYGQLKHYLLMPGQQTTATVSQPAGATFSAKTVLAKANPCKATATDAGAAPSLSASQKLLGALDGTVPQNATSLASVTSDFGVQPNLSMAFFSIGDGADPAKQITASWAKGMLPILTLQTEFIGPSGKMTAANNDASVTSGHFDAQLCSFFATVAKTKQPVVIRLDHEANRPSYPWGIGQLGNTAASYVSMWRHVHDLATFAGASNIAWQWAPDRVEAMPGQSYASFFPGDGYVNLFGLDAYNNTGARYVQTAFDASLASLAALNPTKPIIVTESGATAGTTAAYDSYRAKYLNDLFQYLGANKQVYGLIYSDRSTASGTTQNYGLAPSAGSGAQQADVDAFRVAAATWAIKPLTPAAE